ncbi:MAG: dipeptide ABC transporter ATP-binding protein [Desulfobacteraceae bacterium]|nr:dipeptide ABC transporter ATP-binding protein [Desulfobacteraceae bacterium]
MNEFLLEVENLKIHFPVLGGIFQRKIGNVFAVDGVSFHVRPGETLGVVGESGCGKTTLGRAILRLYRPTEGSVTFKGRDISGLRGKEIREIRKNLQMIFQDPFESLNSRHTIGEILEEPFIIHKTGTATERRDKIAHLLERVGMTPRVLNRFPHEFSGGQRQRIGIARAIALNPELVICDEPVSALDVSIQSQILNLLMDLQKELTLTYLFIAHDLSVVKHVSDRIMVMYLGKIVEYAHADDIYARPLHPYTRALISAIPIPDPSAKQQRIILKGDPPSPANPPSGCRFHTRCPLTIELCKEQEPALELFKGQDSHLVACHRAEEEGPL